MSACIFTSTGCVRCAIVKRYFTDNNIPFIEHDIKTEEGNAEFKAFYRKNRSEIRRDASGIYFPVVQYEEVILQDAGQTLAWLEGGSSLAESILANNLGHGWTGGLRITACSQKEAEAFLRVVSYLKQGGLRTEAETWGDNPGLLQVLLEEELIDRCIFHMRHEYVKDFSGDISACAAAWVNSVNIVSRYISTVEFMFYADLACNDEVKVLSPQEVACGAYAVHTVAGNKIKYIICDSSSSIENLFPYRTAARRWQIFAEVKNQ